MSNAKEEIVWQIEIFWDYKAANSFSAFELLKEITNCLPLKVSIKTRKDMSFGSVNWN